MSDNVSFSPNMGGYYNKEVTETRDFTPSNIPVQPEEEAEDFYPVLLQKASELSSLLEDIYGQVPSRHLYDARISAEQTLKSLKLIQP